MKENMRSRKGVALAEVVIALVVITIVSAATLSVIFSSVQIENKTIVAMDVRNQAENAIECFRFADGNLKTFVDCLKKTEKELAFAGSEGNRRAYVLDKGGYKTTITVTVEERTENNETKVVMASFEFKAVYSNSQSNDLIREFNFPKSSTEGGTTE